MKLQTQIPLVKANNKIDHNSQLLLLGSCFVENIGDKLAYFKFQTVQNPFGILFHPLAFENLISRAIHQSVYTEKDVFFLNDKWQCYDAHSDLSAVSKELLLQNLNTALEKTKKQLECASHIVITLGTAWVYELKEKYQVVANCHKVPQKEFDKKLLSVKEIEKSLENTIQQIHSINKNVQFIYTVSPVRHLKDGFMENQLSKAHLITALHQVLNSSSLEGALATDYFPSYELMMDELRDYRFYTEDMVHPNKTAIQYIWEKFVEVWISEKAIPIMGDVETIQKALAHKPFHPEAEKHQKFRMHLQQKIDYIQKRYPFIRF